MSEHLEQLVKKYHAFHEVSPYNIVIEEGHGSPGATRRIIQAGFDVDVRGLSDKSELELPPPAEYALGYAEVKRIADAVSHHPVNAPSRLFRSLQLFSRMHVDISSRKQSSESEFHVAAVLISMPACRNNTCLKKSKSGFRAWV